MQSRTPCSRKAQVGGSQNLAPSSTVTSREHSVPQRPVGDGGAAWVPNPPGDADTRSSLRASGAVTTNSSSLETSSRFGHFMGRSL